MPTSNPSPIGSVLNIPETLLNDLDSIDKKVKSIQEASKATSSVFNAQFASMTSNVGLLGAALDEVVSKIKAIGTASSGAKAGVSAMGSLSSVATDARSSFTQASEAINRMNSAIAMTGREGTGAFMAAQLAVNRLIETMKNPQSGGIISDLKAEIESINSTLKSVESELSASEQQGLVERRRVLQDSLNEAQRTQKEREVNLQKTLDRMAAAEQAFQAKVRKGYDSTAEAYRKQNFAKNTSVEGALDFADTAHTYNRMATAVDYLNEAKKRLSTTDEDFAQKTNMLNEKLRTLKDSMRDISSTETVWIDATRAQGAENRKRAAEAERAYQNELRNEEKKRRQIEKTTEAQRKFNAEQTRERQGMYSSVFSTSNVSFAGAMTEAKYATSINERMQAIKLLESARAKLSVTDSEYTKKLSELNSKIRELTTLNEEAAAGAKNLNQSNNKLLNTVEQLKRAFALMFSVSQIRNFVSAVASVRGEFELQQRSLQAILQNKTQADAIYRKTLSLALESPFRAKELITFTKQLAAYRIETGKLYDTTKRLADVSAGLGVDMQRLILAYGQVKAAAYLRGTEVRQFTEAGINIYGELQSYFQEVKGEAYTTAQIVDMISKRKVTFEDIEQIFKRLTDNGGIFYNMQKIQVEALQGKLGKLRDAYDQMLNSIGESNESALKGAVDASIWAVQNWEKLALVGKSVAAVLVLLKLQSLRTGVSMRYVFSTEMVAKSKTLAKNSALITTGLNKAAVAAKNFGRSLKVAFMSNAWLVALMAVFEVVSSIIEKNNEYNDTMNRINDEYGKQKREIESIRNLYGQQTKASTDNAKTEIKNTKEKRVALEKLIEVMKQANIVVPVKVEDVADSKLDEIFNQSMDRYERYMSTVKKVRADIADNINNGFIGVDEVDDDLKDYAKDANALIAHFEDLDGVLNAVSTKFDKLPKQVQNIINEINDKEYDSANLDDVLMKISDINRLMDALYTYDYNAWHRWSLQMEVINDRVSALKSSEEELLKVRKENGKHYYEGELSTVAADLQKSYAQAVKKGVEDGMSYVDANKTATMDIKAVLDKMQAEGEINELGRLLLEKSGDWSVNIKITDENALEKQLNWIEDYIREYLDSRSFSISIDTNISTFSGFKKAGDEVAQKAKELMEAYKRLERSAGSEITVDDNIRDFMNSAGKQLSGVVTKINKNEVLSAMKSLYDELVDTAINAYGVDESEFNQKKKNSSSGSTKRERDILSEQVALLKEMQQRYEKLTPFMGAEEAAKQVKRYYDASMKYVKMPQNVIEGFVPTKQGVIDALNKIVPYIKDFKKRMDAQNTVAEMKIEIDKEKLNKEIENAKKEIETALSSVDLYTELSKMGVGEVYIRNVFGDIPKNFSDVQAELDRLFDGKEGENWEKAREDAEKSLNDRIQKYNLDTFKELVNAYKEQLSDQLQLDRWYIGEKSKIYSNTYLNKAGSAGLRANLLDNLDKEYKQKTDDNTWNDFKASDFYIQLFENMEGVSNRMAKAMLDRLKELKNELKNLSPEQLKEVVRQIEQLEKKTGAANPIKTISTELPKFIQTMKKRNRLEKEYLNLVKEEDGLKKQEKEENGKVAEAQKKYDLMVASFGVDSESAKLAKEELETAQQNLETVQANLKAQKELTKSKAKEIETNSNKTEDLKNSLASVSTELQNMSSGYVEFEQMMENFGVSMPKEIAGTLSGLQQISSGIQRIVDGDIVGGLLSAVAGIGNTIGSIFGFGNKDKKLEKSIQTQQKKIERLQRAYENLTEAMDRAWNSVDTAKAYEDSKKNLEEQLKSYEAMAKAEEDKKKTDNEKLQGYRDSIEDIRKQLDELNEQEIIAFGAIGESNYKDAAQEFADAWMDAFNETSNTLDALQETMDKYFDKMLKTQVMQRAAKRYLEPIFKAIDEAVMENSDGGFDLTEQEYAKLNKLRQEQLEGFDKYAKELMEALGIKPGSSSGLSKLQQGIQNITESQGDAIESLLNSIRFFVAQQTTDIAAIRARMDASGGAVEGNSPILSELRNQTALLNRIYKTLSDIVSPNHPKAGYGVKVFLN